MKELISAYINNSAKIGIILVVLASFFLFSNLSTNFYDTPKFIILAIVTLVIFFLITLKFTVFNRVVLIRTPLDIPLLLTLAVAILSTIFSGSPYVSLIGNQSFVHGSLSSIIIYVLFYFVLTNAFKAKRDINLLLFILTLSGAVLSLITLLAYAGVTILPPPWVHGTNFTPTGSNFTTSAILALLLPVVLVKLINDLPAKLGNKLTNKVLNSVFFALFGVTIFLTGNTITYIAGVLGVGITLLVAAPLKQLLESNYISLVTFFAPVSIVALVIVLSIIPPFGLTINPLYDQFKNFQRGITAEFIPSWKVSASSFRDHPFLGSGPATYLFDYTNYKPVEANASLNWNTRFDSAFNEYFQVLATLGGFGLIALISLTALFIRFAYPALVKQNLSDHNHAIRRALAISGIIFFVILALHPSTLVLWVVGLMILAGFYILGEQSNEGPKNWNLGGDLQQNVVKIINNLSANSREETIRIEALPSILLTVSLGIIGAGAFFGTKFVLADYHQRLALNAAAQNQLVISYNELVTAERLNPNYDQYRINLAQINFALANAIAVSKGPTESSPSGSLNAQDQQNIQALISQSINEARSAVALSPRSALNWEILALLYRQISGIAENALTFSLDAYGNAIIQDPLNPNLRLAVGGVYYSIRNYDLAIRFFTDSINLKPDFPNGYYNLSVALRDKGDLQNAQAVAERMIALLEPTSQDFEPANAYLTDLKNRIASGSAQASDIKAPASQTEGALTEENLPKVVDVGVPPENIASPSAVEAPEQ